MQTNQPIQFPVLLESMHPQEVFSVTSVLLVPIAHPMLLLLTHLVNQDHMPTSHRQLCAYLVQQVMFAKLHQNLLSCVKMELLVKEMLLTALYVLLDSGTVCAIILLCVDIFFHNCQVMTVLQGCFHFTEILCFSFD